MLLARPQHGLSAAVGRTILLAWATSDEVNPANLNRTFAADALVIPGASQSGSIYPNISDALTAGHKAIAMASGSITEDVAISGNNIHLFGMSCPHYSGAALSGGPRVTGKLTITGHGILVENIGFQNSANDGALLTGNNVILRNVVICNPTDHGVRAVVGYHNITVENCKIRGDGNEMNGILVVPLEASSTTREIRLYKNWIYGFGESGILLYDYGSDTTGTRNVMIDGNTIDDCGVAATAAAIKIGSYFRARVINNLCFSSGNETYASDGIYCAAPNAGEFCGVIVEGNTITNNVGYGINLASAVDEVLVGLNFVKNNTAGEYNNCGSCPGYVTTNTNYV